MTMLVMEHGPSHMNESVRLESVCVCVCVCVLNVYWFYNDSGTNY